MTSPVERIMVECPACRTQFTDWRRATINVDLDPGMDAAYIEEVSTAVCPECAHKVRFDCLVVIGDTWVVR